MTRWEEGDRFKLEAKGRITRLGRNFTVMALEGPPLTEPESVEVSRAWFDEHATKIERPLEFGQRVTIYGEALTFRVLEQLGDTVRVWPEGLANTNVFQRSELTLTDDQD